RMRAHERCRFAVDITLPLDARSLGASRHLAALEADTEDARAVDHLHGGHVVGPAHRRIDDAVRPPLSVQLALVRRYGVAMGRRVGVDVDEHADGSDVPFPDQESGEERFDDFVCGAPEFVGADAVEVDLAWLEPAWELP